MKEKENTWEEFLSLMEELDTSGESVDYLIRVPRSLHALLLENLRHLEDDGRIQRKHTNKNRFVLACICRSMMADLKYGDFYQRYNTVRLKDHLEDKRQVKKMRGRTKKDAQGA
jgi:hypothetical protein